MCGEIGPGRSERKDERKEEHMCKTHRLPHDGRILQARLRVRSRCLRSRLLDTQVLDIRRTKDDDLVDIRRVGWDRCFWTTIFCAHRHDLCEGDGAFDLVDFLQGASIANVRLGCEGDLGAKRQCQQRENYR